MVETEIRCIARRNAISPVRKTSGRFSATSRKPCADHGGGYLFRDFTSQRPGSAGAPQSPPANAAEQLPIWVQNYLEPVESPQFKVDDTIRTLDYQPSVRTDDLPAWVQRYMTPAEPPQFKVDEFIRSLR